MTSDTLSALRWHVDAGADEAIDEAPRNRFAVAPQPVATGPVPAAPRATARSIAAANETADAVVQSAREIAAACQDLASLRDALAKFDSCALKATAKSLVFGDGNPEAPLMLVGEAPGADEDREGRPFVGVSGQLLDRMLAAIGQDRTSTYITNILPWRPPGNRKPTPAEILLCQPFVERHIELVAPKLMVCVGGTATNTLLDRTEGITRLRGRWLEWQSTPVIAIYHPAYLLRQPALKKHAWKDMLAIQQKLKSFT